MTYIYDEAMATLRKWHGGDPRYDKMIEAINQRVASLEALVFKHTQAALAADALDELGKMILAGDTPPAENAVVEANVKGAPSKPTDAETDATPPPNEADDTDVGATPISTVGGFTLVRRADATPPNESDDTDVGATPISTVGGFTLVRRADGMASAENAAIGNAVTKLLIGDAPPADTTVIEPAADATPSPDAPPAETKPTTPPRKRQQQGG